MGKMKLNNWFAAVILVMVISANAQSATITVQTDQPGAKLNPAMWGIFFEDIILTRNFCRS
jgi:alpha-L-arabinofuranosidase